MHPASNWAVSEGWHDNHHAFPDSAFHGLERGQFEARSVVTRTLERGGLAWNARCPTGEVRREARRSLRAEAAGDPAG